jgi:superfamily II RNA helicase
MRICNEEFISTAEESNFFSNWKFELSNFQKWSIRALLNNKHALITAHTGSGKTVPAEAAIIHFTKMKKKVIYTSPIKALTNQKFNEFSKKFPNISFGILTGDNKFNPEADVLLMTAEILRNTLFQLKMIECGNNEKTDLLSFDIDIENDVGCVIIDEAHYINDVERGRIWEEKIILTPPKIPLLLLSATLSRPEELARFIENRGGAEVYICPTYKRQVPLTHMGYLTIPKSYFNKMTDSERSLYSNLTNTFITLKGPDEEGGLFEDKNYEKIKKTCKFIQDKNIFIHKHFVINELINKLNRDDLLPAIIFVFSRKQVDILANKVEQSLHGEESKIPSIIDQECKKILKKSLPNWQDFVKLPEYSNLVKLLEKGIAVHHAGMLKEFRELIELLFEKKYIKVLFATETFAVGINMPTRTAVFTSLEKFDGKHFRLLEPSEYTQMAGRAGRRGIDTKGTVIHLNNLFTKANISTQDYRQVLTGPPKSISSKFSIHPNLLLHLIGSNNKNLEKFVEKSMISKEITFETGEIDKKIAILQDKSKNKPILKTSEETLIKLINISKNMDMLKPKKRKQAKRDYDNIIDIEKYAKEDIIKYNSYLSLQNEIKKLVDDRENIMAWVSKSCRQQKDMLQSWEFIDNNDELTIPGKLAVCFQEVFSFPFAEMVAENNFEKYSPKDIAICLSCCTCIKLSDDNTVYTLDGEYLSLDARELVCVLERKFNKYIDLFNNHSLVNIETTDFHLNLCEIISTWYDATSDIECNKVLNTCKIYDIGLGDFVKAVLKIKNICYEIEKAATVINDVDLLSKLSIIPDKLLKHCITNQSLYL